MDRDFLITLIVVAVILVDALRKTVRLKRKNTPSSRTPVPQRQKLPAKEETLPAREETEEGFFWETPEQNSPVSEPTSSSPPLPSPLKQPASPLSVPTSLSHLQQLILYKEILDKPRCLSPFRPPW